MKEVKDYNMINLKSKKDCCGCMACYNICHSKAIRMVDDEYGFKYPVIDKEKCVNCGMCENACPILNTQKNEHLTKAYACINKDELIRRESSSGGIFSLLAKQILMAGGIVFGATFDDDFNVKHTYIEKDEELNKIMGSKYVQSDIGENYKFAKQKLEEGKPVLFSGTPCQIQGLQGFLNKKYANLCTVDVICHGVPSPRVWELYKNKLEQENNSKLKDVTFREKSLGWKDFSFKAILRNKKKITEKFTENSYMKMFLNDLCLRDICYECKFKGKNRASDITLGDFWGIEKVFPEIDDNKGVSLVITNTEQGEEMFKLIKENVWQKEVDVNIATKYNPNYSSSPKEPGKRENFFKDLDVLEIEQLCKKYVRKKSLFKRVKNKIKKLIKTVKFY